MVLERVDGGTTPARLSRFAAISAAGATTTFPAEPAKAPPLPVAGTSLALTLATSPVIAPFSEPTADANRPVAPANAPALPHSRPTQERFFWPSRPYYAATRLMIAMKPVAF
ncbi:MAG: hypothetical protein WAV18_19385, partial [Roseiarcus sp.]